LKIGNRYLGENKSVFIVAEAGDNHNGDIEIAKKLIEEAHRIGADAIKFQTWKTERIMTKKSPAAAYQKNFAKNQFEMAKKLELREDTFRELAKFTKKKGIIFLSTPFDEESVDFLDSLVPAFKIASSEVTNTPLLEHIANKKKPIILSTGMSTMEEIRDAVDIIKTRTTDIILLHCISSYPTKISDVNMRVLNTLREKFNLNIGYSDHTIGIEPVLIAVSLGAVLIEKHFTLDKNMQGPDHKLSSDPDEFRKMIELIRRTEKILGSPEKRIINSEKEIRKITGRSIVAKKPISKGTEISIEIIDLKRPSGGLTAKDLENVLGKIALKNIEQDEIITFKKLGEKK